MISVDEFKQRLSADALMELADELILSDGAAHVSDDQLKLINAKLAETYGLYETDIRILVTGSAKLGFSLWKARWRWCDPAAISSV